MERQGQVERRTSHWLWLGLVLYMVAVALYFVGRYEGRWAETDSATFTNIIRAFVRTEDLVPAQGWIYPNGYAYQALSTFIISLTGLDVVTLQRLVYPISAVLVVLPAWVLYRELSGNARGATITTALLLTQPEFLFVILRSSHEKFTRTLMLIGLFLLVRSVRPHDRPWLLSMNAALFYLAAFALIASNNLFAHSFMFAVAVALALGWFLGRRNASLRQHSAFMLQGLLYLVPVYLVMVYVFDFYIYQPAQHNLAVMTSTWDRIAALLLDVQSQATNPYAQVGEAWVQSNGFVYLILSSANWIILATSLVIWIRQGVRWLLQGEAPRTQTDWLLWLLYAAFAAQGAFSVLADMSGVLSGNLQHRLFPSWATIGVALVGVSLARWRPGRLARPLGLVLGLGIFCIAVVSVLKATNEPLVSNRWTFYRSDELAVLDWSDAHLKGTEIWTEFDERLLSVFLTERENTANNNQLVTGAVHSTTRNIIVTTITRLRSSRQERALPVPVDALRIYDNGEAELYHLRPLSPYQR